MDIIMNQEYNIKQVDYDKYCRIKCVMCKSILLHLKFFGMSHTKYLEGINVNNEEDLIRYMYMIYLNCVSPDLPPYVE